MSKIGRLPVVIPSGVTIDIQPSFITVKGPKGELKQNYNRNVMVEMSGNEVHVKCVGDSKMANAAHGLYRSLIRDMVIGVTNGFSKTLIITGVGYRAEVKGKTLVMNLGFSNDVVVIIPNDLNVTADAQGKVTVSGIDKQKVGEFSAEIRNLRKPEPYKGKGIRYDTEIIRRKVGKTGVK